MEADTKLSNGVNASTDDNYILPGRLQGSPCAVWRHQCTHTGVKYVITIINLLCIRQ